MPNSSIKHHFDRKIEQVKIYVSEGERKMIQEGYKSKRFFISSINQKKYIMEKQNKVGQIQSEPPKATKEPRYKSYWQVMLIVINLSLSNFYFGYCLVYISTVEFQYVIKTFKVTMEIETARGILTGCIPFGALFGALLGKKLIHVLSRRHYILVINAMALIAGALLYIQQTAPFIIMRLIQGACIGMYTAIIPMTISEISPIEISGSTGAFTQIFCSIGTTSAYLFYYILSVSFSQQRQQEIWYYVFGLPLITVSIQTIILLFVFPYETPKYFLLHHQKKKAHDLIAEIYKPEYVDTILQEKMKDVGESLAKEKIKKLQIQDNSNKVANQNDAKEMPPSRIPSKVSMNSALSGVESQQPDTASLPVFTSIHLMILRQFVGINAVLAYGGSIVKNAVPSLRAIAPIVLTFETLLGALLSIYLLARLGRRTILQGGTFILAVSMLLITIGFFILNAANTAGTVLILLGLIVFMFTFGATLGSTIWLYTAEICQPSYIIIATCVTWFFASIVIVFFPILKNVLPDKSPVYLFLFFFIWTTISFVINHKVLIQTKGKTELQIQIEYRTLSLLGSKLAPESGTHKVLKQQVPKEDIQYSKAQESAAVLNIHPKNYNLENVHQVIKS